jgi:hypothetical protein
MTLRDELVLPNVPAVIAAAAQSMNLAHVELWAVCEAIRQTPVWTRHAKIITSRNRFVCELSPTGSAWRLVSSGSILRLLPSPPADERDRPWRVLPGLKEFEDTRTDTVLVIRDAPHLAPQDSLNDWRPDEVANLIASAPMEIFKRRAHVTYLATFLDAIPGVERASPVGTALFELLRNAVLVENGPVFWPRADRRFCPYLIAFRAIECSSSRIEQQRRKS